MRADLQKRYSSVVTVRESTPETTERRLLRSGDPRRQSGMGEMRLITNYDVRDRKGTPTLYLRCWLNEVGEWLYEVKGFKSALI